MVGQEAGRYELPITFDTLRDKNLQQLKVLNEAILPIRYSDKVYQDCLAYGEVTQLAYHNDVLIGAIACRLEKQGSSVKLYLMTLGVLSNYRNMGVGRRLLQRCLRKAQSDKSLEEAYLHVQVNNEAAIRFYKHFDFETCEIVENYYKKLDPPDAVILRRKFHQEEENDAD
eukprot:TRINITY_DN28744_c0_g3_i3.p3 TRINITY_DN28744_c0_g3~~TRINITY_DN28744_c0_g3_i3.p3  ORF type:complete len:184 (-),score=21.15 TRINITY_DN28744_c0_g3_i3:305-817(-)